MTIINPDSETARLEILSSLAKNVGRRMGLVVKPYESTAINDLSSVHWMFIFDEHENRIYRVARGQQQLRDIAIDKNGPIDLDDVEHQVRKALTELN
jgi:hypothetical protein